jgi:probable phosphoglycerate mutase
MKKFNLIILALVASILVSLLLASTISCAEIQISESTTVILVRHGETDWNTLNILQGQANTTLNDTGITQMENLGALWEESVGLDVDLIYSSPLLRASQSAEILGKYLSADLSEIILDDNLQEMGLGILTGLPESELRSNPNYLAIYKNWLKDPNYAQPSGPTEVISEYTRHYLEDKEFSGESLNTVQRRAWNSLEKIITENKGETILCSTHGGIIQLTLCKVTDTPLNQYSSFSVPNASIIILEFKNDGTVIWVNTSKN